ncbi:MAG: hypothetical protein SFW36_21450, partial [Leptolyngbyaceae cyanobacterium bins.59]|nr:hypothetical protein [Leptolyngbyaceae cyanobacterium bins.59]
MLASNPMPVEPVTLNNCDREPIHIPGSIQPHGILLGLTEPNWTIAQASENTQTILGIPPRSLLGQPAATLLPDESIAALQQCLERDFDQVNPIPTQVKAPMGLVSFSAILHRSPQGQLILELEPHWETEEPTFQQFYHLTRSTLTRLQQAPTL